MERQPEQELTNAAVDWFAEFDIYVSFAIEQETDTTATITEVDNQGETFEGGRTWKWMKDAQGWHPIES